MMDIHPLLTSVADRPELNFHPQLATYSNRPHAAMIIDATTHNSSMPVSPKQGETIGADSMNKQEPQLVSSSSWEHIVQKTPSSSSPSAMTLPVSSTSIVSPTGWPSSAPVMTSSMDQTSCDASKVGGGVDDVTQSMKKFQASHSNSDLRCEPSWHEAAATHLSENKSSYPSSLQGSDGSKDNLDSLERGLVSNVLAGSIRNCDRPDSSPSSPSQFNSSFEETDQVRPETMPSSDPFGVSGMNLDGSFERRSRRKPTSEDIVRRVKPPIDAPPYDSEESEIEDDIMNEEMMMKLSRVSENDEVDGTAKPPLRTMEDYSGDERYKEELRQYSLSRLSRLEAVDGIPEDDEDMEMSTEEDFGDAEKAAFYKDIPLAIYNLMHEVKVNAHAMFMKTANCLPPVEAKVRREEYLLRLLANLRDRCLEDGLKAEIIGAILKDVESEISSISEDYEEMKMKQYMDEADKESRDLNGVPPMGPTDVHFFSRPEDDREGMYKTELGQDQRMMPSNPPTFLNPTPPLSFTSSASSPTSSTPSSVSSPSTKDVKPVITTISAHGVVSTVVKEENIKGPPPLINNNNYNNNHNHNNNNNHHGGGINPLHNLASNISETAFSPNMFPGNGKLGPWFPGSLLHNMPMYPFSPTGGALDHAFARKFLPFEGKMGETIDKDYLKCQFCERTFRRQKNLENHIESTHQGKNPLKTRRETTDMYFKCSHCPYTTKHQSNLYVHLRIHTGERPYICGACGVQYSQSHSLKSHIINKHDGIMSYYIKEKRTRSPRGMGYLSTQIMHDNSIFKLPPPPLLGPAMHSTNLDLVNKAIEMAKSEHAHHQKLQQQQQQQQQQHQAPPSSGLSPSDAVMGNGMPPPLTLNSSLNTSASGASTLTSPTSSSNAKSPTNTPSSSNYSSSGHNNHMLPSPGGGNPPPHPSFFMNGHPLPPLMFGEMPPHLRNPNHPHHPHLFPTLPFPPHSSAGFPGNPGMSPLHGLSPNSSSNLSSITSMHQSLPPHMSPMFGNFPHLPASPLPVNQQVQAKKDGPPPQQHQQQQQPSQQQQQQQQQEQRPQALTPASSKQSSNGAGQPDEAIDLRKKSPPPPMPYCAKDQHAHSYGMCQGKENCAHAAKLKYLRLNVVRMLGILVPNLNFAEKGISAESESVDELLQDVIESNSPEEEILE